MTQDTNTASGAADLLDLIEAYAEARHRQGHYSYNAQTAAALQAVKDALAAWQATAAQADSVLEDAARYRWLAASCRSTSEHWGGRWSIIIDGPAPKSHDSEDDFDAAVDAARKQGGA